MCALQQDFSQLDVVIIPPSSYVIRRKIQRKVSLLRLKHSMIVTFGTQSSETSSEVRMEGIVSLSCPAVQNRVFRISLLLIGLLCICHRTHTGLRISLPGHEEAGVCVNIFDGSYLRVNNSK